MRDKHLDVSTETPAAVDETVEEVLGHLSRLSIDGKLAVLRAVTPRILSHLQEVDRESFLGALRQISGGSTAAGLERGSGSDWSVGQIIDEVLDSSREVQVHFLRLAAPHVVTQLAGPDRMRFVDELDRAIYGAQPEAGM